jgi:hypothetical protein
MAVAGLLIAAAASWSRLSLELREDQVKLIRRELAAAVHGSEWDPTLIVETLIEAQEPEDTLWRALWEPTPAYPEEPVVYSTVDIHWAALELRLAIERSVGAAPSDPDAVDADAEERVFNAPMHEVGTAETPLLVLERDGNAYAPAFQFDAEGRLLESAAVVNQILGAGGDPWGAASWWLTPHATLRGIPADLLRFGDPADVVTAAAAAGA